MIKEYDLSSLDEIAIFVLQQTQSKIILFEGEMGVGKTTLIKAIVEKLGSNDVVNSPTFSLVNEYKGNENIIYHFDFYRINNEEEAYDIGFEEYLDSNNWCLIEWPNKVENLLPLNVTTVTIKNSANNKRTIEIVNNE
ncbi:MAG: tRNA (adenosine(37)-N6)-threonylcarbamoyltransferase complex ATPase subunit type 1 TsaE [Lutibacter sp.]